MKKMMMFGAIAALALSVQAGSFVWGFQGGCDDPLGTSGGWYEGGTAFLYLGSVSFDSSSGTWNTTGATLLGGPAGYDGAIGYGELDNTVATLPANDGVNAAGGDAYTLILLDGAASSLASYTGDGRYAYIETGTSQSAYRMVGTDVQYFATMMSDTWVDNLANGGPWTELSGAPEPTSGLLLLIGAGLLGLRRKRA